MLIFLKSSVDKILYVPIKRTRPNSLQSNFSIAELWSLKRYWMCQMKCSKCPPALSMRSCKCFRKFWIVFLTVFRGRKVVSVHLQFALYGSMFCNLSWLFYIKLKKVLCLQITCHSDVFFGPLLHVFSSYLYLQCNPARWGLKFWF